MRRLKTIPALLLYLLIGFPLIAEDGLWTVTGRVFAQESGTVYLQLVDREAFKETGRGFSRGAILVVPADPPREGSPFVLEEIPAGTYGIRAFLDKNGNGKIDFTFRGNRTLGLLPPGAAPLSGPPL